MPYPERLDPLGILRGRLNHLDGRVEFSLSGELDLESAEGLEERLRSLAGQTPGNVVVDLSGLTFLGSSGLRALLTVKEELDATGRRLVLRNVTGAPRRAMDLMGAVSLFELDGAN